MTYYITCLNIVCILFKKKTKRTYVENNEKIILEKKIHMKNMIKVNLDLILRYNKKIKLSVV